jgi:hypothetical protein
VEGAKVRLSKLWFGVAVGLFAFVPSARAQFDPVRAIAGGVAHVAGEVKKEAQKAGVPGAVVDVATGPVTGPVVAANDIAHGKMPNAGDVVIKPDPALNMTVKTISAVADTKRKVDDTLDSANATAKSAQSFLDELRQAALGTSGLIASATLLLWALIVLVGTIVVARIRAMSSVHSKSKRRYPKRLERQAA